MVRLVACILSLLMALAAAPAGPVFAAQCANGPCCAENGITGPIVRPKHNVEEEGKGNINLGGLTVLSGILAIGQGLRGGSNKTAATIDKNFEGQDAYLRQVITSLGVAREKAENNREFGPDSRAYNTFDNTFGSRATAGFIAQNQVSGMVRDDLHSYLREFDTRKQILTRLKKAPSGFDAGLKYGGNATMTAQDFALTKEAMKTIIDPVPALNLNENLEQSPLADDYNSVRKAKEARLIIPISVMGDLAAARAPAIKLGDWAGQIRQKSGGRQAAGPAARRKISTNELFKSVADMRFANQQWGAGADGLHGMTKTGVLRELLLAQVDKLMIEYQHMLWLDRTAALAAQKQLSHEELDRIMKHAKASIQQ